MKIITNIQLITINHDQSSLSNTIVNHQKQVGATRPRLIFPGPERVRSGPQRHPTFDSPAVRINYG